MSELPNANLAKEFKIKKNYSKTAKRVRQRAIELGYQGNVSWPVSRQRLDEMIQFIQTEHRNNLINNVKKG